MTNSHGQIVNDGHRQRQCPVGTGAKLALGKNWIIDFSNSIYDIDNSITDV